MKVLNHLVGLLIVGLVTVEVTSALGDVTVKLKPKQFKAINEQQNFEESKYGNAKYHIFEVHNNLEASVGKSTTTNVANDNVAEQTEEIRIEHINAPPGFPLDDPNLDATLLKVAAEDEDNQELPAKTSNTNDNFPVPFPSNYRHDIPKKIEPKPVEYVEVKNDFKSPRARQNFGRSSQYQMQSQGIESLPLSDLGGQGQQYSQQVFEVAEGRNLGDTTTFKGSDYLPPPQQTAAIPLAKPFKGSQFLPSIQGSNGDSNSFQGPDYLPPQEQLNANQAFKGADYLPPSSGGAVAGQQSQETFNTNQPFKGADYLPPSSGGAAAGQQSQETFNTNQPFKGADYLPPRQSGSGQLPQEINHSNNQYKGPDYLPPYQRGSRKGPFKSNSGNKGPDYLPPHLAGSPQVSFRPNNPFQGPDYLPPYLNRKQQQQQQRGSYNAPGYLPPGYDVQKPSNSEAAIAELHTLPEQSQNQQYHQQVTVQSQIQVGGAQQSSDIIYGSSKYGNGAQAPISGYQTPGYLPPGYDVQSQQLSNSIQNPQNGGSSSGYQPPGYLPPNFDGQRSTVSEQFRQASGGDGKSYNAPGYLPPGYDFRNPSVSNQGQNYQAAVQHNSGQGSSYGQQQRQPQTFPSQQQNFEQQSFRAPDYLPPTNIPQAQQGDRVFNNFNAQAFQGQQQQQNFDQQQSYKAPDYLPPTATPNAAAQQGFQAGGSLPPSGGSQTNKGYQASGYLPPTAATQNPVQPQSTYMYPLSSYMTSVQPYERYGSTRKPFPEYGPPPTTSSTLAVFLNNGVAPMYQEPANRPQYYAPGMSYAQNAVRTQAYNAYTNQQHSATASALNQQARQTLQTFMPQEIRQDITASSSQGNSATPTATIITGTTTTSSEANSAKVQTSAPSTSRIRTVQIVKPNAVKTLKVLESLDHAGVKTIQILGPTNEEPMGEHRVVKVVSGHEQTVQTVKIFNDHQDVPSTNGAVVSNEYLPARRKRQPKKTVAKGRKRIVKN